MSCRIASLCLIALSAAAAVVAQQRPSGAGGAIVDVDHRLHLRGAAFDPLAGVPVLPPDLLAAAGNRLFVVQARAALGPACRRELRAAGLEVVAYWPENAYVVRGDRVDALALRGAAWVRWVGDVDLGHKLDPALHRRVAAQRAGLASRRAPAEYALVVADKRDRDELCARVTLAGGQVTRRNDGSIFLTARLDDRQLARVAELDTVLWIEPAARLELDLDNARAQGGADYVEAMAGYTGAGVRVESTEGLEPGHPDWALPVLQRYHVLEQHGHCVAMTLAGSGAGNASARSMLPDAQLIESSVTLWNGAVSRHAMVAASVDPALPWRAMLQTASWGHATGVDYDVYAADLDDALFDHDMLYTQSQGNSGTTASRPEALAKNAVSVGGVFHFDNSNPGDDRWGGAAFGPTVDGRFKPDVVGYYDSVRCGDLVGVFGYSTTNYYAGFGGTSAATPMVAGYLGLIQQMYTDGLFGNPLPLPATPDNRFANRPHAMTAKALLCNTAAAYPFAGPADNLSRGRQGWGFPDVARLYDARRGVVVLDEYDVLQQGQSRSYVIWVRPGTAELRATMAYADPAAAPNAAIHRVNDLDLRVDRLSTTPPTVWHGNQGLDVGNASTPGGGPDDRNTVEQVWLQGPAPDIYRVTVAASRVVADGHPETPQLDVDFALAMHPMGGGYRTDGPMQLDLQSTGPGNLTATVTGAPQAGWVDGFTFLSFDTARPVAFGTFFGMQADALTSGVFFSPAAAGGVFHFLPGSPTQYPHVPFAFPPALALAFSGIALDGMVALFGPGGQLVELSNVDRVVIQ